MWPQPPLRVALPTQEIPSASVPAQTKRVAFAEPPKAVTAQAGVGATAPCGASEVSPAATAAATAAGGTVAAGTPHSDTQTGLQVDMGGGYRCTRTGRWIGSGSWVRRSICRG
jgi:hypothetical protein